METRFLRWSSPAVREIALLLEEYSAKAMLESLLPRLFKKGTDFRCIPFEGKQDLERQLIAKIRGCRKERVLFIVLCDQDNHPDCTQVKNRLLNLCEGLGKADKCRVRIACRGLETFIWLICLSSKKHLAYRAYLKR